MKIAVFGSREFSDKNLVQEIITSQFNNNDCLIGSGNTKITIWVEEIILILESGLAKFKIKKKIFKPESDRYDNWEENKRNQQMVDKSDKIIMFWDGYSRWEKIIINMAIIAGKPVDIYVRP